MGKVIFRDVPPNSMYTELIPGELRKEGAPLIPSVIWPFHRVLKAKLIEQRLGDQLGKKTPLWDLTVHPRKEVASKTYEPLVDTSLYKQYQDILSNEIEDVNVLTHGMWLALARSRHLARQFLFEEMSFTGLQTSSKEKENQIIQDNLKSFEFIQELKTKALQIASQPSLGLGIALLSAAKIDWHLGQLSTAALGAETTYQDVFVHLKETDCIGNDSTILAVFYENLGDLFLLVHNLKFKTVIDVFNKSLELYVKAIDALPENLNKNRKKEYWRGRDRVQDKINFLNQLNANGSSSLTAPKTTL